MHSSKEQALYLKEMQAKTDNTVSSPMYCSVVLKPGRLRVCEAVNYTELKSFIPYKKFQ